MLNREERRRFLKSLNNKGLTPEQKNQLLELESVRRNKETLPEGTKVKIDYDRITSYPDYDNRLQSYKDLIETLKDKECTVKYDEKYQNNPLLVCLEEDPSELKFLFFVKDLKKV